jgi:hypothetical protein
VREVSTFIGHIDHFTGFSIAEHYAMLNRSRPVVYSVPDPVMMLRLLSRSPPRRGLVFVTLHYVSRERTDDELRWLFAEIDAVVRECEATPVFVALANVDRLVPLLDGLLFADLSSVTVESGDLLARAQARELIRVLPGLLLAGT